MLKYRQLHELKITTMPVIPDRCPLPPKTVPPKGTKNKGGRPRKDVATTKIKVNEYVHELLVKRIDAYCDRTGVKVTLINGTSELIVNAQSRFATSQLVRTQISKRLKPWGAPWKHLVITAAAHEKLVKMRSYLMETYTDLYVNDSNVLSAIIILAVEDPNSILNN